MADQNKSSCLRKLQNNIRRALTRVLAQRPESLHLLTQVVNEDMQINTDRRLGEHLQPKVVVRHGLTLKLECLRGEGECIVYMHDRSVQFAPSLEQRAHLFSAIQITTREAFVDELIIVGNDRMALCQTC